MSIHSRATACFKAGLFGAALAAALVSCGGGGGNSGDNNNTMQMTPPPVTPPTIAGAFATRSLVADTAGAEHVDTHLVNGWGIAFNPTGFVWVANNGSATSTLYDGNGVPQTLVVAIPPGSGGTASPTGIVFNGSTSFQVTQNGVAGASAFIFATETGTLSGWSPAVNRTNAILAVDTGVGGAVYKGLAIASFAGANYLYAADFRNARVDVYNANWNRVTLPGGGFSDPSLPVGYAPFGIQAIGGRIYVAYAQRTAGSIDETKGAGLGIVDVFDAGGALMRRLVTGGALNAPWGLAMAPANFGGASNMLLVGNFGDGKINAYKPDTGEFAGTLMKADRTPIVIDGLWGIAFGNGLNNQPANTLFFAAGPGDEAHGQYGRIDPQ
ncbi:TIGR03118 family protein [Massilia sp. LXY-6]|uniref:TIGR03118 family protein n=1 Tax=Massilia sp. LXY-6 TaxID=3379823 RepID=UPI003EDED4F6